jgi:tRNA-specific 2-thiouridylase
VAALSGGVDSATAAAMLVAEGREVVGITMRLYDAAGTEASAGGRCCGPRDIEDARRVCRHLGIPFYVVDFQADFERTVMDDFTEAYLRGETPNPCVRCNQHIKFTPLLKRARALGAEVVATGHYARLERQNGHIVLRRGVDHRKDQSYFLFSMPPEELEAVAFPLGHLSKDEVRIKADELGLPNAHKKDSQEICFVPDGDYAGFVEERAPLIGLTIPVAGDIVDESGAVLGRHKGIHRYTVGQRRGLGDLNTQGNPVYVVRIDRERNQVVVGSKEAARVQTIEVGDLRWLGRDPEAHFETTVQVRHRAKPVPCKVTVDGGIARVALDADVTASPGQAAVFYDGDAVRGGGWIRPR